MMLSYNQIAVVPSWIKAATMISRRGDSLCQSEGGESMEGVELLEYNTETGRSVWKKQNKELQWETKTERD